MGAAMGCFNSKVAHESKEISNRSSHRNSLRIQATENESIKTLTFKHVMKDPLGREYFMKFLMIEHAEENLMFFEEVEILKGDGLKNIKANANALVENFLIPGVDTEVNISDNMKRHLTKIATGDVENNHIDFYKALDRAQHEVMMILVMGGFPRFLKSEYFRAYKIKVRELREKEEEEAIRGAERA